MVQKLCLFIMLFLSASVYAQNSSVKGVVIDFETAQPVPGAKVSLQNKDVSVVSGRDGGFVFKNLSSGQDVVNISVQGYESYHQSFLIGKMKAWIWAQFQWLRIPLQISRKRIFRYSMSQCWTMMIIRHLNHHLICPALRMIPI